MPARTILIGAFLLLLALPAVRPAWAQETRTLDIRDGRVYVDGRLVPAEQLPPSLELEGVVATFSFTGALRPVFELQGTFYALEGERLQEVTPPPVAFRAYTFRFDPAGQPPPLAPARAPGFAPSAGPGPGAGWLRKEHAPTLQMRYAEADGADAGPRGVRLNAPEVVFMRRHATALEQQADVLVELRDRLREDGKLHVVPEIDRYAFELSAQAAEAKLMAQEMPMLEMRSYLSDVEQHDKALFERLVTERDMEAETIRLAHEINRLPEGEPRTERVQKLRLRLREIFELKQENRRSEIAQLERQLVGLRGRLQEREQLRDEIIERRLRQLLDEHAR